MGTKEHVTKLWERPEHKQEEGCISSHEFHYWNPPYPNCAYRVKGYQEIVGNLAKSRLYTKKPQWLFSGRNYTEFTEPFTHQYHHIMPSGVLASSLANDELSILQASRYNINEGINLIILPYFDTDAFELALPAHVGYHKQYSDDCTSVINTMKSDMAELLQDGRHDITDSNVDCFRNFLRRWEQEEFWVIVDYGKQETSQGLIPRMNDGMISMAP